MYRRAASALAGLLIGMGVLHFVAPKPFDDIVPKQLPGTPRFWTQASGVAEVAIGTAVAVPRTRRLGGWLAAALFVAVFPANVQMAADLRKKSGPAKYIAFGRLPLQLPLIGWAIYVARNTGKSRNR
ncbi:hypothetical protein D5S17_31280 [Pseudonocardiaceae bacterium YIM PH 21723]|nr:hypothetical protein D5S17_31280 [Pseudonocardiaceae bacterium YIM PH 21723]